MTIFIMEVMMPIFMAVIMVILSIILLCYGVIQLRFFIKTLTIFTPYRKEAELRKPYRRNVVAVIVGILTVLSAIVGLIVGLRHLYLQNYLMFALTVLSENLIFFGAIGISKDCFSCIDCLKNELKQKAVNQHNN